MKLTHSLLFVLLALLVMSGSANAAHGRRHRKLEQYGGSKRRLNQYK